MPDQFPTLEAAATLAFAILLWQAVLLGRLADAQAAALGRRLRRRMRRGRARDVVVVAVLLGATLYGIATKLGMWFIGMSAGGAVLAVVGGLLRYRIATRGGSDDPAAEKPPPRPGEVCPSCGDARLRSVTKEPPLALHTADAHLLTRVSDLEVCPRCGFVQGRADDGTALITEEPAD